MKTRENGREIEEGRIFMPREADSFHPSSTQINTLGSLKAHFLLGDQVQEELHTSLRGPGLVTLQELV